MKTNNRFSVKAEGNSMFPLLQNGDTVEYIQTPFRRVQLNDIVLIYVGDVLVTHRVIYKTKNTYITRGDNNPTADTVIQKRRVLAQVVRFKRKGIWYDIQDVYLTQSALYLHEIQKLETILQLQKIPHVFLKGVLISLRYENAIPKRIYADCDVLVQRTESIKIERVFKILGYQLQERHLLRSSFRANSEKSSEAKNASRFLSRNKLLRNDRHNVKPEVSYVKMVNGVPVVFDVHFEPVFLMTQLGGMHLLYSLQMLTQLGEQLIKRGEIKKIKGFNYSLCCVSDQILYLALHIFHHNYTDSIRYQLLDAVIRRSKLSLQASRNIAKQSQKGLPPFDSAQGKLPRNDIWEGLARTIKEYRLEGYLYGVFVLLKKYFKTPIPRSFLLAIRPSRFALDVTRFATSHTDIFSQDSRMKAGIGRFILIFLLSPEPLWKKMLLFIHPEVLSTGARLTFSFLASRVSQARRRSVQE